MIRNIPPALKEHFDAALQGKIILDANAMLVAVASSCIGVIEVGGDNRGPLVELFQGTLTTPWGEPWCLDFIQACVAYVEAVKGIKSPLPATESVLTLWNNSQQWRTAPATLGDLILWRLGDTMSGHSGIVTGSDSLLWWTIEGNTSDSTDINRNGDGVYAKKRAKGGTKTFTELGFLTCFP